MVVLILFFIYQINWAQQTKLLTKESDEVYEEYSVLLTDKKLKHGSYLKLNKSLLGASALVTFGTFSNGQRHGYWEEYYIGLVLGVINNIKEKGFYKNNLRDSIWMFFYPEGVNRMLQQIQSNGGSALVVVGANPQISSTGKFKDGEIIGLWEYFTNNGEVFMKFNHDIRELIYLNGADLKNHDSGFIGGEFTMEQYLYELYDFNNLLNSLNSKIHLEPGKIVFQLEIDERGDVSGFKETFRSIKNSKLYTRAIETIKKTGGQWYPKVENGTTKQSQKTITFDLEVDNQTTLDVSQNTISRHRVMNFRLRISVEQTFK